MCIRNAEDYSITNSITKEVENEFRLYRSFILTTIKAYESEQKKIKALVEALKDALCELDPDCKYDGSNYNGNPSDKENSRIQTILALYRILDEVEE